MCCRHRLPLLHLFLGDNLIWNSDLLFRTRGGGSAVFKYSRIILVHLCHSHDCGVRIICLYNFFAIEVSQFMFKCKICVSYSYYCKSFYYHQRITLTLVKSKFQNFSTLQFWTKIDANHERFLNSDPQVLGPKLWQFKEIHWSHLAFSRSWKKSHLEVRYLCGFLPFRLIMRGYVN